MLFLDRLRVAGKVSVVVAMFVIVCAGLMGFSIYLTSKISRDVGEVMGQAMGRMVPVDTVRGDLKDGQQSAQAILLSDPARVPAEIRRLRVIAAKLPKDLETMQRVNAGVRPETFARISLNTERYQRFLTEFLALAEAGRMPEAGALLKSTGTPLFDANSQIIEPLLPALGEDNTKEMVAKGQQAQGSLMVGLAGTTLGLAITGALAFVLLQRGISAPLNTITGAMNRLAAGDASATVQLGARRDEVGDLANAFGAFRMAAEAKLAAEAEAAEHRRLAEEQRREHDAMRTSIAADQALVVNALAGGLSQLASGDLVFRLGAPFPPSYEQLRRDFNEAMDRLQDAMTTISGAALGISAGADEVSRSATDLSQRTEQQAASLEETAAALDQITTAVRRTADGAAGVNQVVASASADAAASSQVVRDSISAISEIQQSARQVSQIIGVIDEIAFQTNLLALNAGVEAARAGEAGRGFAVVATEVRALAQRSAVAAKEIKTLISTSTSQVDTGVQLVTQTGAALGRIHASVNEIHNLISGIAGAAREQASGLDEVNSAVDQMDRITQQNASVVEESTAASFALAAESQQLTTLIGRFSIGDDRRSQAPPEPRRRAPAFRRATDGSAARKLDPVEADDWQEF